MTGDGVGWTSSLFRVAVGEEESSSARAEVRFVGDSEALGVARPALVILVLAGFEVVTFFLGGILMTFIVEVEVSVVAPRDVGLA